MFAAIPLRMQISTLCLLVTFAGPNLFSQADEVGNVKDGLTFSEKDWPFWRGANRNGHGSPNQSPPTSWSSSENIAWKAPIPGRGHGSMAVYGNHVYLQTANEATGSQSVLCIDRSTGEQLWNSEVHASGGMRKNERSTAASSTPACDGKRIIVNFPNSDALYTTALDLNGKPIWQTRICDYIEHQGYGSSPTLYQSLAIISADNKAGGAIAGLDRETGKIVWQVNRPKLPNYPSPIIVHANGLDQLIMTGCDKVSSFSPMTGKLQWEIEGATTECVTSTVTDGARVFSSGGYPKNHLAAIFADGSGKIAWETKDRIYVPSFLIKEKTLYAVQDAGIAVAYDSATGKELWKSRVGGNFSASPVLVGDTLFATNEGGETVIYKANSTKFEQVARNQLGDEVFSTMVICDSNIYYRCAHLNDGKREEFLYCISKKQ